MLDHFAILQLPRRPWLDPATVREAFQRLAGAAHPDAAGVAGVFAGINTAHGVLREASSRLQHLLELEYPDVSPSGGIPAELGERFMEVATLQREAETFLHQLDGASSPLGKALLTADRAVQKRDVEKLARTLERDEEALLARLQMEDTIWDVRNADTPVRLISMQQEAVFLKRWQEQVRETLLKLTL